MKPRRILSCMMALLLVISLPVSALADTWYLENGDIAVNATESGQTVSQGTNVDVPDNAPVITQTITESAPSTDNTVTITAEFGATANVTLGGVNIDTSGTGGAAVEITGNGDVVIELDRTNTVQSGSGHAGVEKNTTETTGKGNLTITDGNETDGSLNAIGGNYGSGIGGGGGGNGSDITISGGTVNAQGGAGGAGIGGGWCASGSDITISGGTVEAKGGDYGSGIGGGGGSGSDITIEGNAEVTATGGYNGAGIGGGLCGIGSGITIEGSAEVTAKGGVSGAGIGGGYQADLNITSSNISVSGNAQVKAQGGASRSQNDDVWGAGAAIGDGGKYSPPGNDNESPDGEEANLITESLNEGWIAKYAPGTSMDTGAPSSLSYMNNGQLTTSSNAQPILKQEPTCTEDGNRAGFMIGSTQVGGEKIPATGHSFTNYISDRNATYDKDGTKTAKCDHCDATHTLPDPGSKLVRQAEAPRPSEEAALYRVIGKNGEALPCKAARQDGVLTITVDADYATLTGSINGMKTLESQGVDTIVFETKGATSTFAISDLLAKGSSSDSFKLTHDGSTVTFTLGEDTDIRKILK